MGQRRSGPPRPGAGSAGHGKADAGAERNSRLLVGLVVDLCGWGVALDRLDPLDCARLALIGLAGGDHLAVGGDQVEAERAGRSGRRGGDWRLDAACAEVDLELFFPESGQVPQAAAAKQVCAGCAVRGRPSTRKALASCTTAPRPKRRWHWRTSTASTGPPVSAPATVSTAASAARSTGPAAPIGPAGLPRGRHRGEHGRRGRRGGDQGPAGQRGRRRQPGPCHPPVVGSCRLGLTPSVEEGWDDADRADRDLGRRPGPGRAVLHRGARVPGQDQRRLRPGRALAERGLPRGAGRGGAGAAPDRRADVRRSRPAGRARWRGGRRRPGSGSRA